MRVHLVDGSSSGYDGCAGKWPLLAASKTDMADGDDKPVTRKNGTVHSSHDEKPPDRLRIDKRSADATDNGVGNIWHLTKE
ncbi:hypothetical protein DXM27_14425 [Rhizobium rhizogenes]|uniref:Uncharacterized protein n=1 Tax=Rhizobium rhizogenes TaxID=359 RepID=A0AA88EY20_RHIRH|nr:hypothetical protein [Rhizobium rhizogenes]KAA3500469.1 hypothetical protein DXM27_14425 [Rhizobium rhizogenes]